jgi:hypothetical protein
VRKLFKFLLPFLFKTRWHTKPDHEIELVFTSEGVEYFRFVNEFKIPYERAMAAMDIYAEYDERMEAKQHKDAYKSIIEYCKKGDLVAAAQEATFCIERMDNITNIDLMYKLLSVLCFDKGENCYSYDYEYNEKKIKLWKKDKDIQGFFLKTPLADHLPSFDGSSLNIQSYTLEQRKQLLNHLRNRLSMLSEGSKNKDLISTLQLQIEELGELVMNS